MILINVIIFKHFFFNCTFSYKVSVYSIKKGKNASSKPYYLIKNNKNKFLNGFCLDYHLVDLSGIFIQSYLDGGWIPEPSCVVVLWFIKANNQENPHCTRTNALKRTKLSTNAYPFVCVNARWAVQLKLKVLFFVQRDSLYPPCRTSISTSKVPNWITISFYFHGFFPRMLPSVPLESS